MPRRTRLLLPLLVLLACIAARAPFAAAAHHRATPKRAHRLQRHAAVVHLHARQHARHQLSKLVRARLRLTTERAGVVQFARRFLGVRYVYGGSSPASGFDCSGFTRYVFAHFGISLPHYTFGQFDHGRRVSRSGLRPGDLVFFDGVGHVGLYIGHGRFIHAPHSGTRVSVDSLSGWYSGTYAGARRVLA